MKHLYTYLPKDNTGATEGVLSTALAPVGWEKYIARSGKTTKEDVLQWLDNLDPGFKRSQAISVFTSPISDEAHPDIKAFRDSKELVVLPQYNDLRRIGIVDAIVRANRGRRGTTRVKYPQYRDIDWASIKPGRFLLSNAPHYLISTTAGKIPPDMIMTKQDFSREMLKEIDKIRSKYGLPLLAVTDGASITRNNGNDTIKKLRETLKKLEKKQGGDPEEDWLKKSAADQPYHTVGNGDTMWGIEKSRGLPPGSIQKVNPGVDPRRLRIGQRLNIPVITPPRQTTAVASSVQAPVNRPQVQRTQFRPEEIAFYNALVYAETGGEPDPWIRTKVAPEGGSTAFGPAQITRTKVKDYIERFPKTMAGSTAFYNTTMAPMYQKFVTYGREPNKTGYQKRWDYGGYGIRFTPEQKQDYRDMALRMITEDRRTAYKELPKGSIEDTLKRRIQLWRGVPYKDDPKYYDKVMKHYKDNFLDAK